MAGFRRWGGITDSSVFLLHFQPFKRTEDTLPGTEVLEDYLNPLELYKQNYEGTK